MMWKHDTAVKLLLIFSMIDILTVSGSSQCDCLCGGVPHYKDIEVCEWVKKMSPKIDSNENKIHLLMTENSELRKSLFEMEEELSKFGKILDEQIMPFINKGPQQFVKDKYLAESSVDETTLFPEVKQAATVSNLTTEIRELEKQSLKVREEVLQRMKDVENQTLVVKDDLVSKMNEVESRLRKTKVELSIKVDQTENLSIRAKLDVLTKIDEIENKSMEVKDELFSALDVKLRELEDKVRNIATSNDVPFIIPLLDARVDRLEDNEKLIQKNLEDQLSSIIEVTSRVNVTENYRQKFESDVNNTLLELWKEMNEMKQKYFEINFNDGNDDYDGDGLLSLSTSIPVKETDYKDPSRDIANGGWSEWSTWTECSVTCGEGFKRRFRTCDTLQPRNGDLNCKGDQWQRLKCMSSSDCPSKNPFSDMKVDGKWGRWTMWTDCSVTCGEGVKFRFRDCDSPPPMNGGLNCKGVRQETLKCTSSSDCTR